MEVIRYFKCRDWYIYTDSLFDIYERCIEIVNSWHVKLMNNMIKHHLCLTRVKKLIKALHQSVQGRIHFVSYIRMLRWDTGDEKNPDWHIL